MTIHSEFARDDRSKLVAEVIEEFDDTGLIIRIVTTGFTGLDVKMFMTYEDARALIETLEAALERVEEAHERCLNTSR